MGTILAITVLSLAPCLALAVRNTCGAYRSCSACTGAGGCAWCGLYAATDSNAESYQEFGICGPIGGSCQATDAVFANLYELFNGSWRSPSEEIIVRATATAKALKTVSQCPTNDPETDVSTFDPARQTCEACIGGNVGGDSSDNEPVWLQAAIFAYGANGAEKKHRSGYCLDVYNRAKWPVDFPLTRWDSTLYTVGGYLQKAADCGAVVPECPIEHNLWSCERVVGRSRCCTWWNPKLETEPPGRLWVYGGYCTTLTADSKSELYRRSGLEPFLTADFGEGNKSPQSVIDSSEDIDPFDRLIFQYGLETREKCLAHPAEVKWCQSTMSSSKTETVAEGGVCMTGSSDACGMLDGPLNNELTITSVAIKPPTTTTTTTTTTTNTTTTTTNTTTETTASVTTTDVASTAEDSTNTSVVSTSAAAGNLSVKYCRAAAGVFALIAMY